MRGFLCCQPEEWSTTETTSGITSVPTGEEDWSNGASCFQGCDAPNFPSWPQLSIRKTMLTLFPVFHLCFPNHAAPVCCQLPPFSTFLPVASPSLCLCLLCSLASCIFPSPSPSRRLGSRCPPVTNLTVLLASVAAGVLSFYSAVQCLGVCVCACYTTLGLSSAYKLLTCLQTCVNTHALTHALCRFLHFAFLIALGPSLSHHSAFWEHGVATWVMAVRVIAYKCVCPCGCSRHDRQAWR